MPSQGIRGLVHPFKKSVPGQGNMRLPTGYPLYSKINVECPYPTDGAGSFFHSQAGLEIFENGSPFILRAVFRGQDFLR